MRLEHQVTDQEHGQRAVDVLMNRTGMSRQLSKRIRLYGSLTRNGLAHRMIDPVFRGDRLVALLPDQVSAELHETAGIPIVYQDGWLLVVDKPAGLVTHPTSVYQQDSLLTRLSSGHLHPISRLDRDTSGLVLIGRNSHAHYLMSKTAMDKEYLTVVQGCPEPRTGLIHAPIARTPGSIIERRADPEGDDALTEYRVLRYFENADCSLLAVRLLTGRTHQIRVHMQYIGHPLVGETLYTGTARHPFDQQMGRQALHAFRLSFIHPVDGSVVSVRSRPPADFVQLLLLCRNSRADRIISPANDNACPAPVPPDRSRAISCCRPSSSN